MCYYPHTSKNVVFPVCGIFSNSSITVHGDTTKVPAKRLFLMIPDPGKCSDQSLMRAQAAPVPCSCISHSHWLFLLPVRCQGHTILHINQVQNYSQENSLSKSLFYTLFRVPCELLLHVGYFCKFLLQYAWNCFVLLGQSA